MDQTDLTLLIDLMNRRKKVFIVATHIDGLTDEELTSVLNSVQDKLAQNMDWLESVKIYPVSSTEALQAKQQGNQSLLETIENPRARTGVNGIYGKSRISSFRISNLFTMI